MRIIEDSDDRIEIEVGDMRFVFNYQGLTIDILDDGGNEIEASAWFMYDDLAEMTH